MYRTILILTLLTCSFNHCTAGDDLGALLKSSISNYMNKSFKYHMEWSSVQVNSSGETRNEKTSSSEVEFLYNDQLYMIFSQTSHSDGINKNTTALYQWIPGILYQYHSGQTIDGAIYSPIFGIYESAYNPITWKGELGEKKPLLGNLRSWGMYEPITFGILPMQIFDGNTRLLSADQVGEINDSSRLTIDLTQEYHNRFIVGHEEVVESSFIGNLKNLSSGIVFQNFETNDVIVRPSTPDISLSSMITYSVEKFDDNGMPTDGICTYTQTYLKEGTLNNKKIESVRWSDLTVTPIEDVYSYTQGIIDGLENKKIRDFTGDNLK